MSSTEDRARRTTPTESGPSERQLETSLLRLRERLRDYESYLTRCPEEKVQEHSASSGDHKERGKFKTLKSSLQKLHRDIFHSSINHSARNTQQPGIQGNTSANSQRCSHSFAPETDKDAEEHGEVSINHLQENSAAREATVNLQETALPSSAQAMICSNTDELEADHRSSKGTHSQGAGESDHGAAAESQGKDAIACGDRSSALVRTRPADELVVSAEEIRFKEHLQRLREMGYHNQDELLGLLNFHHGDLSLVLDSLQRIRVLPDNLPLGSPGHLELNPLGNSPEETLQRSSLAYDELLTMGFEDNDGGLMSTCLKFNGDLGEIVDHLKTSGQHSTA